MAEDVKTKPAEKPEAKTYPWNDTLRTIIYAILLAMVFRSFLFEPFHIPSGSMKNTLLVGDYLFVSKYSYGYSKYSFPYGLDLFKGRILQSQPERGDIVVFRLPTNPKVDYIKRVIGLPGDKIQMIDGVLHINGVAVPKIFTGKVDVTMEDGAQVAVRQYEEKLPEGKVYDVLDMSPYNEVDNTPIYTVPDKHYFMMGDNRDDSTDSRYIDRVGFVPEENLIGRAEIILFSVGDEARFWEFWKWPFVIRANRFFTVLG